jgi:hypothetical protein
MQSFSDDATHDEALSSQTAAVSLLDLTLAHLGVDVGDSGPAVDAVVMACDDSAYFLLPLLASPFCGSLFGFCMFEAMSQLDLACHVPADKAAVLVAAHKVLVSM